jgi:acyl-CoA thioesterase FadM
MEAEGFAAGHRGALAEHKQPARYDDDLEIRTTGTLMSPVRVAFAHEIVRPLDNQTVARGNRAAVD